MKKASTNGKFQTKAYAIILAGGDGERFWPLSTPERPKQFVTLFGGQALIRQAVDRLKGVVPPERTFVITAQRLVALTRRTLPTVPVANVIGEPCRRDTAAAVAVACGLVKRFGGDGAVGCILTADHIMRPVAEFRRTLKDAIRVAAASEAIVTMGIAPTYPATGFGYIELDRSVKSATKTKFSSVRRFVEKPNAEKAAEYLSTKRFLWNSGMFIWRASVMERAFAAHAADIGAVIGAVAGARSVSAVLRCLYPTLRATSVDYAVMEKASPILVAKSEFKWDDVGSWTAVANQFPRDAVGNTCLGRTALLDTRDTVIVSDGDHLVATIGLDGLVVVQTPTATLVCAKNRVQDIKRLLSAVSPP